MELFTLAFRLPFLPVQGLIRVAELIQEQAEEEYRNPAAVRRQLEEAEEARARGEISSEEMYQAEIAAIQRVAPPRDAGGVIDPGDASYRVLEAGAADASAEEE